MWMQGGPGAPSTFGALNEIGRWFIDEKLQIQDNPYSWCLDAHCLFIDNPVQTGFSFQTDLQGNYNKDPNIEYTRTSPEATEQLWQLLSQFLPIFGLQDNPFYITGESYGGIYTGTMGSTIVRHNKAGDYNINFQALALGDPMLNVE